jgi:hypothetical protein
MHARDTAAEVLPANGSRPMSRDIWR